MLLELSRRPRRTFRNKALQAMEDLAEFNLDVFYGTDERGGGLGAEPQLLIVAISMPSRMRTFDNSFAILRTIADYFRLRCKVLLGHTTGVTFFARRHTRPGGRGAHAQGSP